MVIRTEILNNGNWVEGTPVISGEVYREVHESDTGKISYLVQQYYPVSEDRRVTRLAFINRFTDAEYVAIDMASIDDPSADTATRQQAGLFRRYLAQVNAATYIDLDRADTQSGVQTLEAAGILSAGRAAEIINDPITENEKYRG